jgi:hypothetical protein
MVSCWQAVDRFAAEKCQPIGEVRLGNAIFVRFSMINPDLRHIVVADGQLARLCNKK